MIKKYSDKTLVLKDYGVLYAKYVLTKEHPLHWIEYCRITKELPKEIQNGLNRLSKSINLKYNNIIDMDNCINPGCISSPDDINKIANDIRNGLNKIINLNDSVRIVYTIGIMDENEIIKQKSIHNLQNDLITKLGRFLDSSNRSGIFVL